MSVFLVALYVVAVFHYAIPSIHDHKEDATFCPLCLLILSPVLVTALERLFVILRDVARSSMRLWYFPHFLRGNFSFQLRAPPHIA